MRRFKSKENEFSYLVFPSTLSLAYKRSICRIILKSSAVNNNKDLFSPKLKDFSYLSSVKSVIKGNAGSIFDTVNGTKVLEIYQPIKMGNRSWGVILTEPEQRPSLMNIR